MSNLTDQLFEQLDKIDLQERGMKMTFTALAAVGTYYLGRQLYSGLRGLTKYCLLPRRNLKERYGGGWALVTGASDGLGKQYALELARSGFNIILMARNAEKTEAVAKEIRDTYGVQTHIVVFDFMELQTEGQVRVLEDKLAALDQDISILVNNEGQCKFGKLQDQSVLDLVRQVNVNVCSQTYMSYFMVPRLLKRTSRSAIINLSSVAYYTPGAMVPVYSAVKSFNFTLSQAMTQAYASDNIDVMTVTPAACKSQMNSGRYIWSISAERHGKAVIDQLGWQEVTRGSVVHALQPRINAIWPIGAIITHINGQRRAAWAAEQKAQTEK